MIKTVFILFCILLFVYMVLPGPTRVEQFGFPANSLKSNEPGDTVQVPNLTAYFSDLRRGDVISFYKNSFSNNFQYFGFDLPLVTLNHPPERSHDFVRNYIQSWYLEELVHPLRESLYVNGWEPFDESGVRRNKYAHGITIDGQPFFSKTTLRYYPSPLWARILVWAGIVFSVFALYKLATKTFKERYA